MELWEYWRIVRRRMWIVALLLVGVLIASLLRRPERTPMFQASMRLTVGVPPESSSPSYYAYDRYYNWLSSQYLADDLSEILKSEAFARDVAKRLGEKGLSISAGAISGSTASQKLHRILTLTVIWPDERQALAIAQAAAATLEEESGQYLAHLGSENAAVRIIDWPKVGPLPPSLKERLDIPVRFFLALAAGLGLAFLLHYLDQAIYRAEEVRELGMEVLGEIPGVSGWRNIFRRRR